MTISAFSDNRCLFCGRELLTVKKSDDTIKEYYIYHCSHCGKYYLSQSLQLELLIYYKQAGVECPNFKYDLDKLSSYIFYNESLLMPFISEENYYNKIDKTELPNTYNLTSEMVEAWYPNDFAEKIDKILLCLYNRMKYIGQEMSASTIDLIFIFFLNKIELLALNTDINQTTFIQQLKFYFDYFEKAELIKLISPLNNSIDYTTNIIFQILPKGLVRIDELQKNKSNNKNVFVAMKFGEETKALREKIKEGLKGYNVRIMDEIEHNHQIVPEMLYEIRNCRFVVVELSNHNNGAYYEAGYALGLGKDIIHICKSSKQRSRLHFDVAQVNTILYNDINEIPKLLRNRIEATIENK